MWEGRDKTTQCGRHTRGREEGEGGNERYDQEGRHIDLSWTEVVERHGHEDWYSRLRRGRRSRGKERRRSSPRRPEGNRDERKEGMARREECHVDSFAHMDRGHT